MGEILSTLSNLIMQFVKMVRPNDIVDVLIVTFVFIKLAALVKETRAEQLLKGIIILLLATQASALLQLNTINFILRNTMQVGVVAILVVFQPELRRALEKVGRSTFANLFNVENENLDQVIDEIVKAANFMSKERIGALIVIERDTKIGDIIRTGIEMEAKVSAELLINIFIPNTPLHDGAVIIRENKIKAAACLLPLTQNEYLNKELGTRHRAALGITESSDAVVVVVSEESGKISFTLNGDMTRNLTAETLKKALLKTLQPDGKSRENHLKVWRDKLKWKK